MRKGINKGLSKLVVIAMIAALFPIVKWNTVEVRGEVYEYTVATAGDLNSYISKNTDFAGAELRLQLEANIEIDASTAVSLSSENNVTIDLNGHNITANMSNYMISSNGQLAIIDSSGGGNIVNSDSKGGIITTSGGSLTISGGIFNNPHNCVIAENTTINITGGSFLTANAKDGVSLYLKEGNTVTISGENTIFSSPYSAVSSLYGSSLTINGGGFIVDPPDDSFGFAVYVDNVNGSLTITDGRFTRNGKAGKALYIGSSILDSSVHLRGGTYFGGIGRNLGGKNANANFSVYYGMTGYSDLPGIIDDGYVLTDNTFVLESEDTILDTIPESVSIVSGTLLKPNTRRSSLENLAQYAGDTVDYYSVDPISIGTDGTVYRNTGEEVVPAVDESLITNGITYTFNNWMDKSGNTYVSVNEFLSNSPSIATSMELNANWKAQVSTNGQLLTAISDYPVDVVELTEDVTLEKVIDMSGNDFKTIDLGGHTISYTETNSDSLSAAISFFGNVLIKNGTITSSGSPALNLVSGMTIQDLHCISDTVTVYANATETNNIISGVFETTGENTPVLQFGGDDSSKDSFYKRLFDGDSYPSSSVNQIVCDESEICSLNTTKLLVSTEPITYINEKVDSADMGEAEYGTPLELNLRINNTDYIGDIVITGISIDNEDVFTVTGESGKTLAGGSSDTYNYTVNTNSNVDIGTYTGTLRIEYTKMDGTEGTIYQNVTAVICEKTIDSNGTVSLVAGKPYRLESGNWKVNGDTTVYSGNNSFFVSTSGNYTFQKQ